MEQFIALFLGTVASWLQNGKGNGLNKNLKFALSLGASVIAGSIPTALSFYQSGTFDPNLALGNIGLSFTASQTIYNTYFKPKK